MMKNRPGLRVMLAGAALALATGVLLALCTGLSPLAAADRPALALMAVCLSLPLGAALGGRGLAPLSPGSAEASPANKVPDPLRLQGNRAFASLLCGVLLALFLTGPDPALFARTASWCAAATVIGASIGSIAGGAKLVVTLGWLALCAGPFAAGNMGSWQQAAEMYAMQGCPWLGFAQDAIGGDPLRRSVIYLGQWSSLGDQPALGLLTAAELWGMAALSLAASLLRAVAPFGPRA